MTKTYKLDRTDGVPLEFTGKLIAEAQSPSFKRHTDMPDARSHWFEANIYQTMKGRFVVQVLFRFSGNVYREMPFDDVCLCQDSEELLDFLNTYVPTDLVCGFPDDPRYVKKQRKLMEVIDEDFSLMREMLIAQLNKLQTPEVVE